jgi:hypothetical protein
VVLLSYLNRQFYLIASYGEFHHFTLFTMDLGNMKGTLFWIVDIGQDRIN